jgi:hypothetical protein
MRSDWERTNKQRIVIIAVAITMIVLAVTRHVDMKYWFYLNIAEHFCRSRDEYIWQLYQLSTQYSFNAKRQIVIHEKILSIDSTRIEPFYVLGFEYMRLSKGKIYYDKDEEAAALWRERSLDALSTYVNKTRPQASSMAKAADLYYSFGYNETALAIYRDMAHLIETDSILFYDAAGQNHKSMMEKARRIVEKETTLIKSAIRAKAIEAKVLK